MLKVYGDIRSGNCYKVKLLMHLLDIQHEWIHVDILKSETHTAEFKAINPNAKIPALVMENGDFLWESNAILNYLADGTVYLPSKKYFRAKILQWQFFEQYSHEPYIAVARYLKVYLNLPKDRQAEYDSKMLGGYKALSVMENHLLNNRFFVANMLSIADISLYAYTHVAEQGGFDLAEYPNVISWMSRIESKLKHQTMQEFIHADKRKSRAQKTAKRSLAELSINQPEPVKKESTVKANTDSNIYEFSLSEIGGDELPLSHFQNKVILLVNVASECGLTPQYSGLQNLHEKYQEKGFSVIGVPCNQFGAQEPKSESEIKEFCDLRYKVTFPMSSKIAVNGEGRHPIYEFLAGEKAQFSGDIAWNFSKFLIDKNGQVVKRFEPDIEPHASELVHAIEAALKA